ncbi:MAG: hypothetical protein IT436_15275 [Phycisphaerales bacterium]|nr:hypothetical protein [Phycisphaerales bacterium]
MNNGLIVILVIVLLGLGITGAIFAHRQQQKRRQALAELAARLGWTFVPDHERPGRDEYSAFPAFTRGHSQARFNTLAGPVEICGRSAGAVMGDFRYKVTSSNGKTTTTRTYNFSYLIIDIPLPGVPDLVVRREHLLDKLAGALGFDDIDFESEEFSRKFHVTSPDRKFAYDVIHPRMMEFLMSGGRAAVEIRCGRLCLTDGSDCWEPGAFADGLDWTREFFGLWPEYLTQQLTARS